MNTSDLVGFLLPEGMLDYFEVTNADKQADKYTFYLEEKNLIPAQYKEERLHSKGFLDPITIQDFPLRGKACFLKIKRRRWTNLDTGLIVSRDWDIVAKGARITSEFATFLKAIN